MRHGLYPNAGGSTIGISLTPARLLAQTMVSRSPHPDVLEMSLAANLFRVPLVGTSRS